jgi:hypothetical protein
MPEAPRHPLAFFAPDLARGPFTSNSPTVAGVQLAAALAQVRAPLSRSDADLIAHVDFIRALADRLFPDAAELLDLDVGVEVADQIQTTIRQDTGKYALLHCWLADTPGGGETTLAPTSVTWNSGVVLQTVTAAKRFLVLTPANGVAAATVQFNGDRTWYWAVARHGRVFYSSSLNFD